jgi:hypothetical protein
MRGKKVHGVNFVFETRLLRKLSFLSERLTRKARWRTEAEEEEEEDEEARKLVLSDDSEDDDEEEEEEEEEEDEANASTKPCPAAFNRRPTPSMVDEAVGDALNSSWRRMRVVDDRTQNNE